MADAPWLTIIGLGEDGPEGLTAASRAALEAAEVVMGPPRHLALLGDMDVEQVPWPVPFADGVPKLLTFRRRRVVVLASGDPFWFGAGRVIAQTLEAHEWVAIPGVATFSRAANHLGWPLETVACLGLHAAPFARMRPHLAPGARLIVLLRDGAAVNALGPFLEGLGFGDSRVWVMEALGGPREAVTETRADALGAGDLTHPVCVAIDVVGDGPVLPRASGLEDDLFDHDGQITKRPVRALTLSALAPRPGERLWDIGGGSGSVAIEWLLSHPTTQAVSVEARAERAERILENATRLGVDRLEVVEGRAPDVLDDLPVPDAVFIGGGLSATLLEDLAGRLAPGTRLVANAVTLESEAILSAWRARIGGDLMRIELSHAAPLGAKQGWKAAYPVVQWRAVL